MLAIFILLAELAVVRLGWQIPHKSPTPTQPPPNGHVPPSSLAPSRIFFRPSPVLIRFSSPLQLGSGLPSEDPSRTRAQPFVSYLFPLLNSNNLIFPKVHCNPGFDRRQTDSRRILDVCFHLFPSSVACRSCCSFICFRPFPFCYVTSRLMIYLEKDFLLHSVLHFSAEHHLTTSFNLFLTVCYWASYADIDLSSFNLCRSPQPRRTLDNL